MHTIKKLVFCIFLVSAPLAFAEDIPLKAFASLPLIGSVRLSPDGLTTAYIQNVDGKSYLVTQSGGVKPKAILTTDNQKFYFSSLRWANDKRLLIGVRYPDRRYGSQSIETRMLAINSDGSNLNADLLRSQFDAFSNRKHVPQFQDRILGKIAGAPDSVLVSLDLDNATKPDVYRLNVETAELKKVMRNPGNIYRWMADRNGEARVGTGWSEKTIRVIVKAPGSDKWETLSRYTADNYDEIREKRMTPLGFDSDPNFLYVNADHQGKEAVFRVDLSQAGFPRTLVHADARFDVDGGVIYAPWLKKVVGLRYSTEYGQRLYWDDSARQLQQQLDGALPGHNNILVSSSDDGMRHIVASLSLAAPPRLYWLDRKAGKMSLLAETYPELASARLATPQSVNFKSRDGISLHGYLTMPLTEPGTGQENRKAPLILFPHGGPGVRDVAGFDYWTQFFASRGWAVLQVNFRGSSGYGSDFETAGFKRWGMEMQDDLTDGVDWLARSGKIDPSKVCIVGASYGGYAALMGVVKTPDLYRCAVSIAGVADLRDLLAQSQRYIGYEIAAERQIGEWWNDRERLRQTSPVNRVKEIRTPLLLIHGKEDRIVDVEQSRDMASALKSAGNKDYRYVELPLGDHNLSREEDRVTTFTEMEKFLRQYLD
ncbi:MULTISPECIES: S9 family peptidase [unclassified Herbaspirillum]|uniref:alpha/beta hydrolase family protein n=1 Tax=unclassified Herbaspirillum TaxID=2624150 RepID=UPI001313E132|nr:MULTISPECIES: S9 family peptidase [unclassified Herbaspirillum]